MDLFGSGLGQVAGFFKCGEESFGSISRVVFLDQRRMITFRKGICVYLNEAAIRSLDS